MKRITVLLVVLALMLVPVTEAVTVNSAVQTVALTMTVAESLTIIATPATIAFTYDGVNKATASGPISINTVWTLAAGHTSLTLQAYFSAATSLTDGTGVVATSNTFQAIGAGAPAACNTAGITTNSCPPIFTLTGVGITATGNRTDAITLSLNNVGVLPAGPYTGTLNLQAIAN